MRLPNFEGRPRPPFSAARGHPCRKLGRGITPGRERGSLKRGGRDRLGSLRRRPTGRTDSNAPFAPIVQSFSREGTAMNRSRSDGFSAVTASPEEVFQDGSR